MLENQNKNPENKYFLATHRRRYSRERAPQSLACLLAYLLPGSKKAYVSRYEVCRDRTHQVRFAAREKSAGSFCLAFQIVCANFRTMTRTAEIALAKKIAQTHCC